MEIARKLAEDCCKQGTENQSAGSPLARATFQFGTSHGSMENERETMLGILGSQGVFDEQSHENQGQYAMHTNGMGKITYYAMLDTKAFESFFSAQLPSVIQSAC
ncbi:hypothetical protein ACSBR1_037197 [Camellia fascicularis]